MLRQRPEEKRLEWLLLFQRAELHSVGDLRRLEAAHWERLQLPLGVEQALQHAIRLPNPGALSAAGAASQPLASAPPGSVATKPAAASAAGGGNTQPEVDALKDSFSKLSRTITAAAHKAKSNLSSVAAKK